MQSQTTTAIKHVTNRQGVRLAEAAREHKVPREVVTLFLKDKDKLSKFFEELKGINPWFEGLQAEAKKIGARVYLIPNLMVDYTKRHNDAAMAGGPQTGSDYNVLKVADLYQPENQVITETIILFNWPNGGGSYQKAVEWGLSNSLRKTTPHVPFAIGEKFLRLNYELGPNPMYVVETAGCMFDGDPGACFVSWYDAERESGLDWRSRFGRSDVWFAFRK